MPKYLLEASYTDQGLKGLFKEGGTGRRAAVETAVKGLGGSVEAFYYVFGDDDVIVICDLPDNVTAAAFSLGVSASGAVSAGVRVLITAEEIDAAVHKSIQYRPPGQ